MVSIKKLNYFDIETIFFNYISYIFQLKRKWYVVHTQLLSVRYRVKPLHFFFRHIQLDVVADREAHILLHVCLQTINLYSHHSYTTL